jgi:hypothetical protein
MIQIYTILRSWFWEVVKPVLLVVIQKGSRELLDLTMEFVVQASTNPDLATGEAKRLWVASKIKAWDLSTGKETPDRVINFFIEVAVIALSK